MPVGSSARGGDAAMRRKMEAPTQEGEADKAFTMEALDRGRYTDTKLKIWYGTEEHGKNVNLQRPRKKLRRVCGEEGCRKG